MSSPRFYGARRLTHQFARLDVRKYSQPARWLVCGSRSRSIFHAMSATRILWGQIAFVLTIVLITTWGATQWTAWRLGYQPQLGHPWFELAQGVPIYLPPAFFWWWYAFDAYAPGVFVEGACVAASGGVISIIAAFAMSVWRAREAETAATYGTARWASQLDIRGAGLTGADGVILGCIEGQYLRHDGPEHVLCFAPTRSGKGVGLVVPTLLTWPGSCIVHDIKGENWTLTSGFRARHGRVLLFDPTNSRSAAYNPLLEVRRGEWEVRDVQNVADVLVDPEGSLERRNHWEKTSHALLVGAILHVLYAEQDKTLAGVASFLSDPKRPIETTLRAMMTTQHLGEAGTHPVIASAARELLNKSENERSGVLSTAMSFLGLYRDPVVAQVTRRCDWRIRDLIEGEWPTTLYLVVPPSDISRTKPLVRLILNQIGRRLTEDLQAKDRRQRLLFMLDEFPALGRLDFFESALAFMAGYGLKSFLIAQSLNQIEKAYGPNNAILDNCHVRVAKWHLGSPAYSWSGPGSFSRTDAPSCSNASQAPIPQAMLVLKTRSIVTGVNSSKPRRFRRCLAQRPRSAPVGMTMTSFGLCAAAQGIPSIRPVSRWCVAI